MTPANSPPVQSHPPKAVKPEPPPLRKIVPQVKHSSFEFQIRELLSSQKVDGKRGGVAIQNQWKILGVFKTHVAAKNALAAIEYEEKHFDVEAHEITHLCGHPGTLRHRIKKEASVLDRAGLQAHVFPLIDERARGMPCLKCFCDMAASGEKSAIVNAPQKWHALLNAPLEHAQTGEPIDPTGA